MKGSALVLGLVFATSGSAQVTTATFYGILADPSGALVPSASVSMTHQETGAVVTKASDSAGEFQFDFLRVGTYTLRVEAQGFKRFETTGIELDAAQSVRRSFVLQLGSTAETITVEATVPQVNAVSAEQRESLSRAEVTELPVARRNYSNILSIGTGITTGGNGGVRMNGLGRSGLKITVDGTDATSNVENPGTSMYQAFNYIDTMSIEAIEEVQTTKGVISAEYGHQLAGNVNLISKSGTNDWHGSLFENFQADDLNARFQTLATRPPLNFNQFGGSIGGPFAATKFLSSARGKATASGLPKTFRAIFRHRSFETTPSPQFLPIKPFWIRCRSQTRASPQAAIPGATLVWDELRLKTTMGWLRAISISTQAIPSP